MQIKTILNRVEKHSCFVYDATRLLDECIEVDVRPRKNSTAICSLCRHSAPGYDTLRVRRFEFVPLWGIKVFFVYARRRVQCPRCGVKVEELPWVEGKHHLTKTFAWFLARWSKRMSWQQVAQIFRTSWDSVSRSVEMAVEWGRKHTDLNNIKAIGIDELQWKRGHRYLTLVYEIGPQRKRLLWIGRDRKIKTLLRFFPLVWKAKKLCPRVHL